MQDLISRQAAIDAVRKIYDSVGILGEKWAVDKCQMAIEDLPSAQPETSILTVTVNPDSEEIERVARKIKDAPVMVLPSAQPERTCVNCGRTINNGGWYADGETRCPIEEHYALPKDGYCHLWEKRNVTDDDYPERRTDD